MKRALVINNPTKMGGGGWREKERVREKSTKLRAGQTFHQMNKRLQFSRYIKLVSSRNLFGRFAGRIYSLW